MATTRPGTGEDSTAPFDPSEESPTETSKPIGDAIPTPVEPGLNQPLPEKSESPAKHDQANSADPADPADAADPLGEPDPPKGVPAPGPSDFALREIVGNRTRAGTA
ncbi:hypothetical protein [Paraburkholderia sp. 2C]